MDFIIKKMETDEEKRAKSFVHYTSWQEAYQGIVCPEYLNRLSLEKCERIAFDMPQNTLIAKDGDKVIGFVAYGKYRGEDEPEEGGEIYAVYILSEYYGTGVGAMLMQAGLDAIPECRSVAVHVLKENHRAVRFYEKMGFKADGTESYEDQLQATVMRMVYDRG